MTVGVLLGSCDPNSEDTGPPANPAQLAEGLLEVESERTALQTVEALREALQERELGIAIDLDHQAGAQGADLTMPASHLFVFGNPVLGTPLMQENLLTGLDLPLKMLVSEDDNGAVRLTYEGPGHLRQRFELSTVDAQLDRAAGVLAQLASAASAYSVETSLGLVDSIEASEAMLTVASPLSPAEALASLVRAIDEHPVLGLFTQIDHQAAAQNVGLDLDFATLVVFGSAAVGTPLMVAQHSVGLDLPLKVLVAELEGETVLAYTDPTYLAVRHGDLESQQPRLEMMAQVLAGLTNAAASTASQQADATADTSENP